MFSKYVQCGSNSNVTKYWDQGIPQHWDMSFRKFGGLPTLVAFPENELLPILVAYAQGLPILVAKILATKFGFVPDCLDTSFWHQSTPLIYWHPTFKRVAVT